MYSFVQHILMYSLLLIPITYLQYTGCSKVSEFVLTSGISESVIILKIFYINSSSILVDYQIFRIWCIMVCGGLSCSTLYIVVDYLVLVLRPPGSKLDLTSGHACLSSVS